MINSLTTKVLHNRAIVIVLMCIFIFCGAEAFHEIPVEAYPDVTNVTVQVLTLFPGHAAEEVERLVTIPIESVMNYLIFIAYVFIVCNQSSIKENTYGKFI